jgi:hypothetical protein
MELSALIDSCLQARMLAAQREKNAHVMMHTFTKMWDGAA